jgi:beta-lactamase superfamily II metal-dependent hydrolase
MFIRKFWTICFIAISLLSLLGCTPTVSTVANTPTLNDSSESLKVIFLDVGQGASQLLISPSGKTMLIDAGNNDKETLMLDYLKKYNLTKLDIVIGTHPDADHIGGLDKVIDHFDIGKIYMPKVQSNTKTFESVLRSISKKDLKVSTAKAGLQLQWDDKVTIQMIAPVKAYPDANDNSAVIHVIYGKTSFMLTGDAEVESEQGMIASGADLQSDVLLVGHHGSKSSTSLDFLRMVKPQYAIIQSGKDNKYGHPHTVTLNHLKAQGIKIYRNDLNGTIEVTSDGAGLQITSER